MNRTVVIDSQLPPAEPMDRETRLRFALYRYGDHIEPCPGRPCECGFLAEWQFAELPSSALEALRLTCLKPAPNVGGEHGE
jgi:hypothetical protein